MNTVTGTLCVAVLLLGLSIDVQAQAPVGRSDTAAQQPPPPPPAVLDVSRIAPYHQALRMIMVRGGEELPMGTLDDQLIVGSDSGRQALIRIQNTQTPAGLMVDTAVAEAASLTPRRHSSHAKHRTLLLE